MKSFLLLFFMVFVFNLNFSEARVHKNVRVGEYESFIDLNEYTGSSFYSVMKDVLYPEFNEQAKNHLSGTHIKGISEGEGVELFLTSDVTTYHVKYKADTEDKVERSGRSFGAVGSGDRIEYVADASYLHYLRSMEKLFKYSDDQEIEDFYRAILMIITNSDTSGLEKLNKYGKRVAADFVAIYIAEQYRRLTATKGKYLGSSHRWDDALVQVTLLGAFHSGQSIMTMFYDGKFTSEVFPQSACLYKASGKEEEKADTEKREAHLYDYWQFTVRSECPGRSGVNLTRRDFQKLGKSLTSKVNQTNPEILRALNIKSSSRSNLIKEMTEALLTGSFEMDASEYVEASVNALMHLRVNADNLSSDF